MNAPQRSSWNPSYVAVLLAAGWLAAISLMKMFAGNPSDLPKLVLDRAPFPPETTFPIVITIELAVALLACARPRIGWIPLVALYFVFEAVLVALIAQGAKSCGCAGGAISIPPMVMASIDSALLLFVLGTRPWSRLSGPRLDVRLVGAGLVALAAAPWFVVQERMHSAAPGFVVIHPLQWVGQLVYDVQELKDHLDPADVEKLPTDGLVLLWRQSCEHCRDHLRLLVNDKVKNDGSKPIVLVQILDDLKNAPVVDALPEGQHVTRLAFKQGPEFAIQTPWELHVEGGIVTRALDEEHARAEAGGN